jgi:N-acetylglutamate synthase-like GNAT family acetyltransferase
MLEFRDVTPSIFSALAVKSCGTAILGEFENTEEFADFLKTKANKTYLVQDKTSGQFIGGTAYSVTAEQGIDVVVVFVVPEFRGQGWSIDLIRRIEALADKGMEVRLSFLNTKNSRKWAESLGYELTIGPESIIQGVKRV